MRNWARIALFSCCASACTADAGGDTDTDTDTDGSSGTSASASTTNPATTDPQTSSTSEGASSSGGTPTTSAAEGSSSGNASSSGEGDGSSSSTGASSAAFEGSYAGTFEGQCPNFDVSGTITLEIDAEGMAVGAFMGNDSGPLEGSVDAMGVLETSGDGEVAGLCHYDGQIDGDLAIEGMWNCPDFECGGTWTAAVR